MNELRGSLYQLDEQDKKECLYRVVLFHAHVLSFVFQAVTCLAISLDEQFVVCGNKDCTVQLFERETAKVRSTYFLIFKIFFLNLRF